eukprot:5071960-Amphidinium_carterae.1
MKGIRARLRTWHHGTSGFLCKEALLLHSGTELHVWSLNLELLPPPAFATPSVHAWTFSGQLDDTHCAPVRGDVI